MTTRRMFLRSAALGAVALPRMGMPCVGMPYVSGSAGARPDHLSTESPPLRFDCIFYDARRSQALAFGEAAGSWGVPTRALSGDIGDACFGELQARWRNAKTPVAGMTDLRALFLLQMMSADAGLQPLMRVHHCGHGASVMHEVFGSRRHRAAVGRHLSRAGVQWGRAAACLVLNLVTGALGENIGATDTGAANRQGLDSRVLVTWVIA